MSKLVKTPLVPSYDFAQDRLLRKREIARGVPIHRNQIRQKMDSSLRWNDGGYTLTFYSSPVKGEVNRPGGVRVKIDMERKTSRNPTPSPF